MYKLLIVVILCVILVGCGSNKIIDGIECKTYGLINEGKNRKENIEYKIIIGNFIWGILLIETVIMPVYFFGFSIYEPVGRK
jgi:hypothetical protein